GGAGRARDRYGCFRCRRGGAGSRRRRWDVHLGRHRRPRPPRARLGGRRNACPTRPRRYLRSGGVGPRVRVGPRIPCGGGTSWRRAKSA
ncbi:unnamed protein product, partial [Laminaria digitata]